MKLIKNKQIKETILRESANYIIALDALDKALDKHALSIEQYMDAVQHVTDNTVEIASAVGGLKGIAMMNEIVKSKLTREIRENQR